MRVLVAAVVAVGAFAVPAAGAAGSAARACGGLVDRDCEWWDDSGEECALFVNPNRVGVGQGAVCVIEQDS